MIPLMKNAFLHEHETKRALSQFILEADRLSMDRKCAEFETRFSAYQGRQHSILFNSGGSANLAILQALKNLGRLKDGDAIGFSALTWSTNTMPIIQLGMQPVPIDCSIDTLNVMATNLRERHSQEPLKAFFATNVLGFAGDLDQIRAYCEDQRIVLIEDNCEALGTELPSGKTGNYGISASFSFFVAHHMSTIEGGMACTDDDDLSEMLKIVRANGWDRNLDSAQQLKWRKKFNIHHEFEAKYTFYDLGYNLRPTEITGFLGLQQLQYLEENISIREKNYLTLKAAVEKNADLIPQVHGHIRRLSNFAFPVVCKRPEMRSRYIEQFAGAGIEIRPMIAGNMQRQPFYAKYAGQQYNMPGADFLHDNAFYCGNYPELSSSDLETMLRCLSNY